MDGTVVGFLILSVLILGLGAMQYITLMEVDRVQRGINSIWGLLMNLNKSLKDKE